VALTFKDIKQAYSLKDNLSTIFVRTNDRWAYMDGYRFLGIAWVIIGHCIFSLQFAFGMEWWREVIETMPLYWQWMVNGDVAIDGFFIVSAFLMTNMLIKQHQESARVKVAIFYISRFMRLTPAYFLAIGVYMLLLPGAWEDKTIWPNFLYIQNFISDYDQMFMHFTWSLALEEQFYIFLPPFLIFIFFKSSRPAYWLIGLFVLSFFIRAYAVMTDEIASVTPMKEVIFNKDYFGHYFVTIYDNLITRYGTFICGIYIAYIYRYHSDKIEAFLETNAAAWITRISFITALGLIFIPILYKHFHMSYEVNLLWQIARRNVFSLAVSWLVICGLYPTHLARGWHNFLSLKFFHPFGHLLYSMYLFHYLAVGFVLLNLNANLNYFEIDIRDHFELWILFAFVFSFIGTMFLGIISYLIIELPVMNLRPK
jgi:peptidoglycan/LPS O-acetylase OafA/YrhL